MTRPTWLLSATTSLLVAVACGETNRTEPVPDLSEPAFVPAPLVAQRNTLANGIFLDHSGREVLLRGINVNSLGEYWQFLPSRPPVHDFTEADMDVVASLGFNFVRLIVTWSTIEPTPGNYDDAYLGKVDTTIEQLWQRGIYTLIDLHQDAWGPAVAARDNETCGAGTIPGNGWDGAPDWATLIDDSVPRCAPAPDGERNREGSPAVRQAWKAFLRNDEGPGDIGLQKRYAAMLEHLAARLGGSAGVMGYDIINEPNAFASEEEYRGLENMYRLAVDGLRAGEKRAKIEPRVIVFEPSGIWAHLEQGGTVRRFSDDPQIAYGPHIYQGSISNQPLDGSVIARLREEAAAYGGIPIIIGEWGISLTDSREDSDDYFKKMLAYQDQERWGMALWQYQTACGDPHVVKTAAAEIRGWGLREMDCTREDELGGWNTKLMHQLARPAMHYAPSKIASVNWDNDARTYYVNGEDADIGAIAVLFVPENHGDLQLTQSGFDTVDTLEIYGGLRITATAVGGAWQLTVAP